jgi:hypothetical protein
MKQRAPRPRQGICPISSPQHKARPDLTDDSGFWLRVKAVISLSPRLQGFAVRVLWVLDRTAHRVQSVRFPGSVSIEECPGEVRMLTCPDVQREAR